MRLILASASPRRAELLAAGGLRVRGRARRTSTSASSPARRRRGYVRRLAVGEVGDVAWRARVRRHDLRARRASCSAPTRPSSSTGEILGKPRDDDEARRHAPAAVRPGARGADRRQPPARRGTRSAACRTRRVVHVRPAVRGEIAWYVDSGEGRDKAGGYAIQGLASRFVPRIDGSYSNVVGLPVALVRPADRGAGGTAPQPCIGEVVGLF